MLSISRHDLAENLTAYGEKEASDRIRSLSNTDYRRICEIGFQYALKRMPLIRAACLAAVEVIEGKPRDLKRKRRATRDIAKAERPPNPIYDAVARQFQRYSGGRPVKSAEVIDHLKKVLGANLHDFRWISSRKEFRGSFEDGVSRVVLNYNRSVFSLSFGVRHERIEQALANIFPEEKSKLHSNRMTISKWSVNMGPSNPRWHYQRETTWPITGSDGLALATPEIVSFLKDVAEPYALRHRDPLAIRNTLLRLPGHADVMFFEACTIFAVDHLVRRRDWLDEDYRMLCSRYAALAAKSEKDFASPPEPTLGIIFSIPKVKACNSWDEQLKRTYDRIVDRWSV